MVKLAHLFHRLQPKKVLVAGDFMLDRYTFGKSKRISPEAPVPVISVDAEVERPGGAGNVAVNLVSLGMEVRVLGMVGQDTAGKTLLASLEKESIDVRWLLTQASLQTPQKARLIASSQQIARIDYERFEALSSSLEEKLLANISDIVSEVHLVAISDYAKGFLTPRLLRALIDAARLYEIPVIADPKGIDFQKYSGSNILKPNLSETFAAAPVGIASLGEAAQHIFKQTAVDVLMITRSEAGISLFYPDGKQEDHPVQAREVKDVTGAGDTVLAVLSMAYANGISLSEATDLANIAAQVAVEKVGCACVTLSEIARKLIDLYAHNKIFDIEHLPALEQALNGRNSLFLRVDSQSEINSTLLKSIRQAAMVSSKDVIVNICGPAPDEELVAALASLRSVNYVLLSNEEEVSLALSETQVL